MKTVLTQLASYASMALMATAAIFAPDGMAIPVEASWVPFTANILGNFVPVLATLTLLIGLLIGGLSVGVEDFVHKAATENIDKFGSVDEALNKVKARVYVTIFVVVFWAILIAAGWIISAVLFIIGYLGMRTYISELRKELIRIKEDETVIEQSE